jgi:hypothetical protein
MEMFDIVEKSPKFLLKIITLVLSVNKTGSDEVFIVGGRSFYIMEGKDPKIDPLGTPCFTVPHFKENFSNELFFFFCQMGSGPVSYCSLNAITV